ncbi:class I SAM-dependent methyltransferase [Saccharothrix sp. AJ9571]|nr:class I SAM-dependent methyltransferase [Saccharothrix sp. AJ9571]
MSETVRITGGVGDRVEVLEYFRAKAASYDDVDAQAYWRLSDALLWDALHDHVLPAVPGHGRMVDAGAGTGRWSDRILRARPDLTATLVDLSPDMLSEAAAKARGGQYVDRVTPVEADLREVSTSVPPSSAELVISFHNVLGFLPEPERTIEDLAALLVPGGQLVVVVPNAYHAAFFNLTLRAVGEAERAIAERRGRFTRDMPMMRLFTPAGISEAFRAAGVVPHLLTGFPVLVYPGYQETQLHGQSASLGEWLDEPAEYDAVHALERRLLGDASLAARGNNLLVVGRKNTSDESR